jgi:hypothetical protein
VFGSFFSFLRKYEKNPIICYPWYWIQGLKAFV